MKTEKDPDHPIIEKPYEYNIKELRYCINWDDFRESYIDLTLIKETTSRELRFIGPPKFGNRKRISYAYTWYVYT